MDEEYTRIKIGLLTAFDPRNRISWASWSDTVCHMIEALEKYCGEVVYLGPTNVEERQAEHTIYKRLLLTLYKRVQKLLKKFSFIRTYFIYNYRASIAQRYVKAAAQRLSEHAFDVIIAPASATEVVLLDTDVPIVMLEDATFAALHNYYPQYTNLPKKTVRMMHTMAARAINKADLLVYTSTWAARSAIEEYHADQQKVRVVPSGANLVVAPERAIALQKRRSEHCRLLFLGIDWIRKGGAIAFDTLLQLEKMGIPAELVVCGCIPPKEFAHVHMHVIPFLNKKDEKQRQELEHLYTTSHFLLLPTRSECYGMVFCEANAYGLPVIATATGGVPEVVRDGENGFLLPFYAQGVDYAQVIADLYRDEQRYTELVRSSRAAFDERLNWDAWGVAVKHLITELLSGKASESPSFQEK